MDMTPCPPLPENFSDAQRIDFTGIKVRDRDQLAARLACGGRVIHLGCCDHAPLILNKMESGTWFHDVVLALSGKSIGVDIDEAALDLCQTMRPTAEFVCWNILTQDVPTSILASDWDWCFLPETLEHLGDPVGFLTALRERLAPHCRRLFCTVPNATLLGNFVSAIRGREVINTDHRHWYTPATLVKVLTDAGFGDFEMATLRYGRRPGLKGIIKRRAEDAFPLLASGIAVSASF